MRPEESGPDGPPEEPAREGKLLVSQLQWLLDMTRERLKRSREVLEQLDRKPPNPRG